MSAMRTRRGFSLLELVVTLVVLGVILGVAVLSYTNFLGPAREQRAGSLLDRVAAVEQPLARDWGSYSSWPADLADVGSDVTILNAAPAQAPGQVSVAVGAKGTLALATRVEGGSCLFRLVSALSDGGGTVTPSGMAASAACTGQSALPPAEPLLAQTETIRASAN